MIFKISLTNTMLVSSRFKAVTLIVTAFFLFISCHSNSRSGNKSVVPKEISPIQLISLPTVIKDAEVANRYLAKHFWDSTSLGNVAILKESDKLREFYFLYLQQLNQLPPAIAEPTLADWSREIVSGPKEIKEFFLELVEKSLFHPNSPFRSDNSYAIFLEEVVKDSTLLPVVRQRYSEQLLLARANRVGTQANKFTLITSTGVERTLNSFKGKELLIMFYDPECPTCKEAINYFNNHPNRVNFTKKMTLLAIYTGNEYAKWQSTVTHFSKEWIVAHDKGQEIILKRLYDRRPSPSFYLLDKELNVLLKDATLQQLYNHPLVGIPNKPIN